MPSLSELFFLIFNSVFSDYIILPFELLQTICFQLTVYPSASGWLDYGYLYHEEFATSWNSPSIVNWFSRQQQTPASSDPTQQGLTYIYS